jgi:hypothetical protein
LFEQKKSSSAAPSSPKPFTTDPKHFAIFHSQLLDKLKQVAQLKMSFERRVGEVQGKFEGEIAYVSIRFPPFTFFPSSTGADNPSNRTAISSARPRLETSNSTGSRRASRRQRKRSDNGGTAFSRSRGRWSRRRCTTSLFLLEGTKLTFPPRNLPQSQVADLQQQLTALRRSSAAFSSPDLSRSPRAAPSSPNPAAEAALTQRLTLAQSRVSTLERRLAATQSQLKDAEDKLGEQRSKIGTAEGKWESRFRELEARCRSAEERVKRERQGAKERVGELMGTIKCVLSPLPFLESKLTLSPLSPSTGPSNSSSVPPSDGTNNSTTSFAYSNSSSNDRRQQPRLDPPKRLDPPQPLPVRYPYVIPTHQLRLLFSPLSVTALSSPFPLPLARPFFAFISLLFEPWRIRPNSFAGLVVVCNDVTSTKMVAQREERGEKSLLAVVAKREKGGEGGRKRGADGPPPLSAGRCVR